MKLTLLTFWSWTSSFQNNEEIKFCYLNYPICGTLLWQTYYGRPSKLIQWPWQFWRVLFRYIVGCVLGRKITGIISRVHTIKVTYHIDIDLDHLLEGVFVSFLHCKVTLPYPPPHPTPFHTVLTGRKSLCIVHIQGVESYTLPNK